MERHFKIFLMAFIGLVFPCLSFASPDFYYFNNFLIGMSPYKINLDNYTPGTNGLWEQYYVPKTGDNCSYGMVASFSTKQMSGTNPASAVSAVNMDNLTGFYYELPVGHATVVYSSTGSIESVLTSGEVDAYCLGSTRPEKDLTFGSYGHTFLRKKGSLYQITPLFTPSDLNSLQFAGLHDLEYRLGCSTSSTHRPYSSSMVWLLVNRSSDLINVYPSGASSQNYNKYPYAIDTIDIDSINWNFAMSNTVQSTNTAKKTYVWAFPDIRGDIDLYSPYYSTDNYTCYNFRCYYDVDISLNALNADYLSSYTLVRYNDSLIQWMFQTAAATYFSADTFEFIPAFLHAYSSSPYVNSERIVINGGEISIDNYDDLIRKLQEAGFGGGGSGGDLTRVIQLMEEINSGGVTGEEVKQLIDTLESYHQQLINNADFGSVTNVFESYKNLLDFSDDMHWLITANNALFGYFAGFIMLCAMFLILNRIMR